MGLGAYDLLSRRSKGQRRTHGWAKRGKRPRAPPQASTRHAGSFRLGPMPMTSGKVAPDSDAPDAKP